MSRRSQRLQEAGYYSEEGSPTVEYKEVLCRVFRRRTGKGQDHELREPVHDHKWMGDHELIRDHKWIGDRKLMDDQQSVDNHGDAGRKIERGTSRKIGQKELCCFFILIPLAVGTAQVCFTMNAYWDELQTLRPRVMLLPPNTPNFALESQGARVLHHWTTQTYWSQQNTDGIWNSIFSRCFLKNQRRVIQGRSVLHPGDCWAFEGERGHMVISLSHPVAITQVTLGHITKSQSIIGNTPSAPMEFEVYGMRITGVRGTFLGKMVYDQDGPAYQTFELPNPSKEVFRHVRLQVLNNWGEVDYTTVYNFRVNGELKVDQDI
ncbi:SUN domain-containing protein 3-like [Eleginops maclovinus]|uniref:SUN domain-containing protein 3-like n=1 Tax=Eleginops maclovinus TaxID=56733 RepID=UPI0030810085